MVTESIKLKNLLMELYKYRVKKYSQFILYEEYTS